MTTKKKEAWAGLSAWVVWGNNEGVYIEFHPFDKDRLTLFKLVLWKFGVCIMKCDIEYVIGIAGNILHDVDEANSDSLMQDQD